MNILLVDDRPEEFTTLEAVLGDLGETLVRAGSREEAIEQAREMEFAVILIGVQTSGSSELEFARLVRSDDRDRRSPIIFLTPDDNVGFPIAEAYALGSVDHVARSLIPVALRSKVAVFVELARRARESQAAERLQLWRTTLASIGDGVIATDEAGRVTFLNPVAEKLTGWLSADACGQPLTEVFRIVNETTRAPVENPALRALQSGTIVGLANHTILIARNGVERPIDDSASPIRGSDGSIGGAVLVFRDITERKQAQVAQSRLAAIVESSDDAIVGKDLNGIVQSWNTGAERIFGYTAAEIVGESITILIPPERLDEERTILGRLRRGERIEHFETVRMRKDGQRLDIALTVSPIRDAEGRVIGASKIARDVTAARQADRVLTDARRRSETALQAGEIGAYHWDLAADRVTGDRNFVALFGVLANDESAAPVGDFLSVIHEDDRERVAEEIRRTLVSDAPFRSEYRVLGSAGERWLLARGAVERNADGAAVGWAGVVVDVTDRKRAEKAVRASDERFRIVVKATNDAVWDWDMRTDAVWWNDGVTTLFGHRADDVGTTAAWWYAHIHPDDRDRVVNGIHDVIDHGGANWSDEYRFRKADESYAVVLDRGYAIREGSETIRLVGAMQDVTERRQAEKRLQESEARFRTLFESMADGYCVVEPVLDDAGRPIDYRYLLANPALEHHTGLKDVVGKTAREVMPTHESHWIEAYAHVALTGETFRRTDFVADLGRWYEVSAFRVGDPSGRQVGVLFADVTSRRRAEEALQASERQLAEVFRHAPSFMAVLRGPDHVFERVNDRYRDLVDHREVVGKPVREALPEVVPQGFIALLDRVYETGEPYIGVGVRIQLNARDGRQAEERFLDFVYQPMRDESAAVVGILAQGIDQTARKRAEALLRQKDERLKLLVDRAQDYAVVVTDREGRIVEWAGGAESITGFAPSQVIGRTADVLFTPEDRAAGAPAKEMATAAREGRAEDKRWHVKKDGAQFFADGVMVPLRDDEGDLHGFGKVFRDVTARKRTEEAVQFLADASASLSELVDYQSTLQRIANLAVGGFADWCVVDMLDDNGRRERLAVTTLEAKDVTAARSADMAFHPNDGATSLIPHVLRTGEPEVVFDLSETDPNAAPQGPERVKQLLDLGIRSYLCVPLVSRGRVIGGMTFLSFSTRRRFGVEELRVAQNLAERVTVAIDNSRLYRALQEQDRRKDEFLATLAHELRNPLAPVRNGVQILRLGGASGDVAERALSMMDRQLGHMAHLVDDLMDVARVSSGKVALRKERVVLKAVVDAAVETNRQAVETAGHRLIIDMPDESIVLDADRTRIVQVLANLVNNAAKYTPPMGRIILSARGTGSEAVVKVADTGVGIPAEMLPKVFDMFTQVGTSLERSQGGLGIGLTLVKRLVEMHGGSVSAESDGHGKGSAFTVRLPLAEEESPSPTSSVKPEGRPADSLNILVVDDNRDAAESLAMLLEIRGHQVRTAHDGPEALRLLGTFRPRLILLDLGLPGMSGYEVARRIRESAELRNVTLAALTGWGQDEDRRRTREAGFDHHLVKPANPDELERVLEASQTARSRTSAES